MQLCSCLELHSDFLKVSPDGFEIHAICFGDLQVIRLVEVLEPQFDPLLNPVISVFVRNRLVALFIGLLDCFDSDPGSPVHDYLLALRKQPIVVHLLVSVKNALLSVRQFVIRYQVKVSFQCCWIVVDVPRSFRVVLLEVFIYFSLDKSHCIEFLALVFEMVVPCKLRLLKDDKLLSLQVDHSLVAEFQFKCLIL